MKISVLVMSHNSQETIERTIKSLDGFDEVIVADGGSTDSTLSILAKYHYVKVVNNKFIGFSNQRNFLLSIASNPWCFFVDSDEFVTPELKLAIHQIVQNNPDKKFYAVKRTEYLDNAPIETGFGASAYQDRLMLRDHTKYIGDIHEFPLIDEVRHHYDSKERGFINPDSRLLHNPAYSLREALSKIVQYSKIKADEKIKQGRTTNAFIIILSFIGTLLKVWLKSFKEGRRGFLISLMEALHRTMVKAIMYEEQMLKDERLSSKNN